MNKWKTALIAIPIILSLLMSATAIFISLNPSPETSPAEIPETPEIPPPKNKIHFRIWAVMNRDTLKSFRDNGGWAWFKSATIEVNIENLGNCDIHGISLNYSVIIGEIDVRGTAEIVGYSLTEKFRKEYFVGDLLIGETKTFVFTDVYIYWRSSIYGVLAVNTPMKFRCDELLDITGFYLDWGNWRAWKYVGEDERLMLSEDFEFSSEIP